MMKRFKLMSLIVGSVFMASGLNYVHSMDHLPTKPIEPMTDDIQPPDINDGSSDENCEGQHIPVKNHNPNNPEADQGLSNWSWNGEGYVGVATNSDTLGSSQNVFRVINANNSEDEYDALGMQQTLTLSSTEIDMIRSGEIDSVSCIGWFDFVKGSQGYGYFYIDTISNSTTIDSVTIVLKPASIDPDEYQVLNFANLTKGSKVANKILIKVQANDGALIDFDASQCTFFRTECK